MNERAQRAESGPRNRDLLFALAGVAIAGALVGGSIDMVEHSPETAAVVGVPALVVAAGAAAIAVSIWNRLTNKNKSG